MNNFPSLDRDLVFYILKRRISDLETELQRKNLIMDYLNFQLSLKTHDNSPNSSVTRNFNDASNQNSVSDHLTDFPLSYDIIS